jgi:hypothetical protein
VANVPECLHAPEVVVDIDNQRLRPMENTCLCRLRFRWVQ